MIFFAFQMFLFSNHIYDIITGVQIHQKVSQSYMAFIQFYCIDNIYSLYFNQHFAIYTVLYLNSSYNIKGPAIRDFAKLSKIYCS